MHFPYQVVHLSFFPYFYESIQQQVLTGYESLIVFDTLVCAMNSGYMPPEYLFRHIVSKKVDIFSLGVVMIKIITGPRGHSRSDEMSYQEFLDLVSNTNSSLQQTMIRYILQLKSMPCSTFARLYFSFYISILLQVQENWRNRLQATSSPSQTLEAFCQQVNICTKIALSCMETDRHKRPSIVHVINKLNETETVVDEVT
jgi:serine/threonine protein kinase